MTEFCRWRAPLQCCNCFYLFFHNYVNIFRFLVKINVSIFHRHAFALFFEVIQCLLLLEFLWQVRPVTIKIIISYNLSTFYLFAGIIVFLRNHCFFMKHQRIKFGSYLFKGFSFYKTVLWKLFKTLTHTSDGKSSPILLLNISESFFFIFF